MYERVEDEPRARGVRREEEVVAAHEGARDVLVDHVAREPVEPGAVTVRVAPDALRDVDFVAAAPPQESAGRVIATAAHDPRAVRQLEAIWVDD